MNDMEKYECVLCLLCRQSALFEHFKQCQEYGIDIPEKELKLAFEKAKKAKEEFLEIKTALGFEGGLSFMEKEASFQGFSYYKNCLKGDYSNLKDILLPMADMPVNKKTCYRHEVAILILTHYYFQKGKYRMKGYLKIRYRQMLIFMKKLNKKLKEKYPFCNVGKEKLC